MKGVVKDKHNEQKKVLDCNVHDLNDPNMCFYIILCYNSFQNLVLKAFYHMLKGGKPNNQLGQTKHGPWGSTHNNLAKDLVQTKQENQIKNT